MALSSPTCNWRRAATIALDEAGVPWRQLLSSANLAALAPVVQAGLAVTVLPASAMRAGFRVLDEAEEGLPVLPLDRIGLLEAKGSRTPEAKAGAGRGDSRSARRPDAASRRRPAAGDRPAIR
jgi:DNA-binding transcriptional LysR family regulator